MRSWPTPDVPVLPAGPSRPVRVTDTVTGASLPVGGPERASLYVCGITPYDATHLGHAATYLTFDLLVRTWRDLGYDVRYTQNVTDVDDPLLERAAATGEDWRALAERETDLFRSDMTHLRVLPPTDYLGAVETIPDVVRAVERLVADGAGYAVPAPPDAADGAGEGDVYAALAADPAFDVADPARREQRLAEFAERGGDPERPGKRDALDPLLWRTKRDGEPAWDGDALGAGRPGWHIECATIAARTLGAPFDVQGGGADLAFPHHAMSVSHLRLLTGAARPVRAHVHVGLIAYEGHKMSKSRGNLVLVSRLVADGEDPMAVRLAVLAHHYREGWEYTDGDLVAARERLALWRAAVAQPSGPDGAALLDAVRAALADDLDAPRALAAVDAWARCAVVGERAAGATEGPGSAAAEAADGTGAPESTAWNPDAPRVVREVVDALLGVAL
ncbi:cysteine--1-D-myo-inosityl 2-amino-2-deoxy-alpha-D-glucopyranoside ligase [Miniimonas arenae]|uniref:cysteine--1-D-myo-inosityl 2-amino-2-deoxy-alpha-D-glucopyranoside ligase n=1 Tax=Miniimonas arenae TaxID=676201 RepID=UPI0028A726F9|nr:cysteine--1-D-myo-inosityl 2-amino-2-deoxy-alpha-D-glucopyranoside ligase [Miniimonas arenae]